MRNNFLNFAMVSPKSIARGNRPLWTHWLLSLNSNLFITITHFSCFYWLYMLQFGKCILSNFSNVRSTKFKEGRKEAMTLLGVFHALAVISIAHFLKIHVCTIYGEKQVRLVAINQTFQFKWLWEQFQLRTYCGKFLMV